MHTNQINSNYFHIVINLGDITLEQTCKAKRNVEETMQMCSHLLFQSDF